MGFPIRLRFTKELVEKERPEQRGVVKDTARISYGETREGRPLTNIPIKDGLTDHSTDALRYFAVGRYLVTPELRSRHPEMAKDPNLGYRVVA